MANGLWDYSRWKRGEQGQLERNRGSKKGLFLRCERLKLVYMLMRRCKRGGDKRIEFQRMCKGEQVEGLASGRRRDTAPTIRRNM